jgi:hypothetical protein
MMMHLFLVALLILSATVSVVAAIAISTSAQNMTRGNTTGVNSTESVTTSEERGAYSGYGG